MGILTSITGVVFLAQMNVTPQPISPLQIVNAANSMSQKVVAFGQGIAAPLAHIGLVIAGIVLLFGIALAWAKLTKSVLMLGLGLFCGVIVMMLLLNHSQEVIGLIYGFWQSFFGSMNSSTSSLLLHRIFV